MERFRLRDSQQLDNGRLTFEKAKSFVSRLQTPAGISVSLEHLEGGSVVLVCERSMRRGEEFFAFQSAAPIGKVVATGKPGDLLLVFADCCADIERQVAIWLNSILPPMDVGYIEVGIESHIRAG